jgi:hypothetical protein
MVKINNYLDINNNYKNIKNFKFKPKDKLSIKDIKKLMGNIIILK